MEQDRESPNYAKLVESEREVGGWWEPKGEVLERREEEMRAGEKVKEIVPLNYPGTNCSYKFVGIRSHSSVREIWLVPKSDQSN